MAPSRPSSSPHRLLWRLVERPPSPSRGRLPTRRHKPARGRTPCTRSARQGQQSKRRPLQARRFYADPGRRRLSPGVLPALDRLRTDGPTSASRITCLNLSRSLITLRFPAPSLPSYTPPRTATQRLIPGPYGRSWTSSSRPSRPGCPAAARRWLPRQLTLSLCRRSSWAREGLRGSEFAPAPGCGKLPLLANSGRGESPVTTSPPRTRRPFHDA